MTGLIAIDESGDLGSSGSRYFCIAAMIMLRSRDLKKASSLLSKIHEYKWYNSTSEKRTMVLEAMADSNVRVVYTVVDKNCPDDNHPVYGNELYVDTLRCVLSDAMDVLPCRDVNVYLDNNGFVSLEEFRRIVSEEASRHNINPIKVNKVLSEQNKCIQLVDFIAGAARAELEHSDSTINIISRKVSVARRR